MEKNIAELFNGTVLQHKTAGNVTTFVGFLPENGVRKISIVCVADMGNSTDMTLTLQTADDASGTSAAALTQNVPIWKATSGSDFARLSADAKAVTETSATGKYVYVFEVPAAIIPAGKYLGISCDSGSASNSYSAIAFEDKYYQG